LMHCNSVKTSVVKNALFVFNSERSLFSTTKPDFSALEKATAKLESAKEAFEKINHYRGLAMVAKLQVDLKSLRQKKKLDLSQRSGHSSDSESAHSQGK
jgi:cell shape-determining protein MreC